MKINKKDTTTLFNKNHITITKASNGKNYRQTHKNDIMLHGDDYVFRIERLGFSSQSPSSSYVSPRKPRYYARYGGNKRYSDLLLPDTYELKKSPLGFYYSEPIEHPIANNDRSKDRREGVTWTFNFVDECYTITYLLSAEDKQTHVDTDTRPWQLVDGSMEEHFIFDLYNEVVKICDRAKQEGLKCYRYQGRHNRGNGENERPRFDAHETKQQIMTDLFGNPDGPKFQTNEEKILAHGFDLITSFRKM